MSTFIPLYTVDAFTSTPFAGNPAAICLMGKNTLTDKEYMLISKEMNLSETAFVTETDAPGRFGLRWFTPSTEVKLCGHATLATSHVLLNEEELPFEKLIFDTLSGPLTVSKQADGLLRMDFPIGNPQPLTITDLYPTLAGVFKIDAASIVETEYCSTTRKLIVVVKSLTDVSAAVIPDASALMSVKFPVDVRGVMIATSNLEGAAEQYKQCDFASRYFAPWVAIPEDPVCGSAHTVLGVYYQKKWNRSQFKAYAASERGGILHLELTAEKRIFLCGVAQTTLKGAVRQPAAH